MRIKIAGTGSYAPEHVVTNEDLAGIVDTSDEWIKSRTGISQRRISDGIGTSGMAVKASERALANAGMKAEEIQRQGMSADWHIRRLTEKPIFSTVTDI